MVVVVVVVVVVMVVVVVVTVVATGLQRALSRHARPSQRRLWRPSWSRR